MRAVTTNLFMLMFMFVGVVFAGNVQQGIDAFYADTTAHKMRLTVRANELMNNPKFFDALPEYKELQKYKEEVVRLIMEHDSSKLYLARDSDVIKIAGEMEGTYWRDLPESNPLRDKARRAFAELTRIDTMHEAQSAEKLFPGNLKLQKLAKEFMMMVDYDDVPKMRKDEFGSSNRKKALKLCSEWIQVPEIKSKFTQEEYERLLKLGKVLESKEFDYSKAVKYYTSEVTANKKFEDLLTPFLKEKYPDKHLTLLEKKFTSDVSFANKAAYYKALKVVPMAALGVYQSYQYAKNPDRNIPENFLKELLFLSTDKPYCRAYRCNLLQTKCAREQRVKETEVDWKKCSQYFYNLSLDQQDNYLKDKVLKDYFQDQAPLISDVTCSYAKNKKQINVVIDYRKALSYGYSQQAQTIFLREDNSFSSVLIPKGDNSFINLGFDSQNLPKSIQECKSTALCAKISVESVKKYGITSPEVKRWINFSALQNKNLTKCCNNSSCISYFDAKNKRSSEPNSSAMAAVSIK